MGSRSDLVVGLLITLGGVTGLGAALAQQDGAVGEPAPEGGVVAPRTRAALTGEQQLEEADRVQRRATQLRDQVMRQLDTARTDRDIIRVTCLDDKLAQLNANISTLERRTAALRDAIEVSDQNQRNHEFTVVAVLDQKFGVLEQEANQCIGQDLFETGATRVVTELTDDVPDVDASQVSLAPEEPLPFIPPPASPVD